MNVSKIVVESLQDKGMSNQTGEEIVKEYLEIHEYDGLYNPKEPCGCFIDDLFPCSDEGIDICKPGYKSMFPEGEGIGPNK